MPKLFKINNSLVGIGNTYLGEYDRYNVTVVQGDNGTVVATPTRGLAGTIITLTSTADSGYELDYYTLDGVALVGDTFTLTADVTVSAVFKQSQAEEVTIGTQTWKTAYLDIDDGQGGVKNCYGGDLKFYTYDAATRICAANYPGWHVAVETDYNTLVSNALDNSDTSTFNDLFGTAYGGTDKYGLNLRPMYLYLYNGDDKVRTQGRDSIEFGSTATTDCLFTSKGNTAIKCYGLSYLGSAFIMVAFSRNGWMKYGTVTDVYTIVRLVKDAV